jgi:hypothetical protein
MGALVIIIWFDSFDFDCSRFSINRPTKRGKEKSPSDGMSTRKRDGRPFTGVSTNS